MKKKFLILVAIAMLCLCVFVGCSRNKEYELSKKGYEQIVNVDSKTNFIALENGKYYLFNKKGKKVFKTGYDNLSFTFYEKFLIASNNGEKGVNILSLNGTVIAASTSERIIFNYEIVYGNKQIHNNQQEYSNHSIYKGIIVIAKNLEGNQLVAYYNGEGSVILDFSEGSYNSKFNLKEKEKEGENSTFEYERNFQCIQFVLKNKEDKQPTVKILNVATGTFIFESDERMIDVSVDDKTDVNIIRYENGDKRVAKIINVNGMVIDTLDIEADTLLHDNGKAIFYLIGNVIKGVIYEDAKLLSFEGKSPEIFNGGLRTKSGDSYKYYDKNGDLKLTTVNILTYDRGLLVDNSTKKVYDSKYNLLFKDYTNFNYVDSKEDSILIKKDGVYQIYKEGKLLKSINATYYSYNFYDNETSSNYVFQSVTNQKTIFYNFLAENEEEVEVEQSIRLDSHTAVVAGKDLIFTSAQNAKFSLGEHDRFRITSQNIVNMRIGYQWRAYFDIITLKIEEEKFGADYDKETGIGEKKTYTKYFVFLIPSDTINPTPMLIYSGYNQVNISTNENGFLVSTVGVKNKKGIQYSDPMLCEDSTVYYKLEVEVKGTSMTYKFIQGENVKLSNCIIISDYLLVENMISVKPSIYTINGKKLVDSIYYVKDIKGNLAIVSFNIPINNNDENFWGIIELTENGYKVKEKLDKKEIQFISDNYYYYKEHKKELPVITLKTFDGSVVAKNVQYIDLLYSNINQDIVNDKIKITLLLDFGKSQYKYLQITVKYSDNP